MSFLLLRVIVGHTYQSALFPLSLTIIRVQMLLITVQNTAVGASQITFKAYAFYVLDLSNLKSRSNLFVLIRFRLRIWLAH